jgi:hypothetical protein
MVDSFVEGLRMAKAYLTGGDLNEVIAPGIHGAPLELRPS